MNPRIQPYLFDAPDDAERSEMDEAMDEILAMVEGEDPMAKDEDDDGKPDVPDELALLPLRDSVIYPMLIAPLSVARESSIKLIDDAVSSNHRVVGVVTQKTASEDEPGFDGVYDMGCAVIIRTMVKAPDSVRLIVQGVHRIRIVEPVQTEPYLKAKVEVIREDPPEPDEEIEALRRSVGALFEQAIRLSPNLPDELSSLPQAVKEPNVMADLVAAHSTINVEEKQQILDTIELRDRMKALLSMLGREVRVLELTSKVQGEVSQELSKTQREYYLREQLRQIQKELGEDVDRTEELADLAKAIAEKKLSPEARTEVEREYDRLKRINPASPEYSVARTYIDTVLAMPFEEFTEDHLDLKEVRETLDNDHFGLDKIKKRILEYLAVRKVKTDGRLRQPILCFAGPPGVGKTSLGRSIAHAMNRKYQRISLGGVRDEAEIRGHRRTYIGAMPGQFMQALRRAGVANPVLVLDEIDKLASDGRGDPSSALLEVLDPEQNGTFRDHYLDVPFDLSKVLFITTANNLDAIPGPLRDRMEVIQLAGYTEAEKVEIGLRHLVPKQIDEHGLSPKKVVFTREAIEHIIRGYTREAGVRNLEREIGAVVRRITMAVAEGDKRKVTVTPKYVEFALGAPRFLDEEIAERVDDPGTAIGLAWTAVGGDVLVIETTRMPGPKGLIVTGQLGDVMKESVSAALSYVRAHATELGIPTDFYEKQEIHVHVPAGAVPKDGPSAGVTMLTALTSLLSGRRVRPHLAMTGEISLTGHVLPVGGIKEKVIAAQRAGIKTVILPAQNEKDYREDVPQDIRDTLKVHFVKRGDQVLKLALEPAPRSRK